MQLQWFEIVGAIILVDLTLSGDNALVIGAVASRLKGRARRQAIILGGAVAIILRIAITIGASFVLNLPYVKAIGGLVVFIIAFQLILGVGKRADDVVTRTGWQRHLTGTTLASAILAITIADLSMSLDNILAIAALANGKPQFIIAGLLVSIFLLLLASSLLARLLERFPLLLYGAGLILAWTAGTMIATDHSFRPLLQPLDQQVPGPAFDILLPLVLAVLTGIVIIIVEVRRQHLLHASGASVSQSATVKHEPQKNG